MVLEENVRLELLAVVVIGLRWPEEELKLLGPPRTDVNVPWRNVEVRAAIVVLGAGYNPLHGDLAMRGVVEGHCPLVASSAHGDIAEVRQVAIKVHRSRRGGT